MTAESTERVSDGVTRERPENAVAVAGPDGTRSGPSRDAGPVASATTPATTPAEPSGQTPSAKRPGLMKRVTAWGMRVWERISAWSFVAHILRALDRYNDRLGSQFAAAITYFSLLSLVPILMVSFSIAGFVLAGRPDLVAGLKDQVIAFIPGSGSSGDSGSELASQIGRIIDQAVSARFAVGLIGLVVALYSGIGWMGNIRRALRAIWAPYWNLAKDRKDNIIVATLKDLGLLAGLGLAVVVSFGLSTAGNAAQGVMIRWLGLQDAAWAGPLLSIATLVIAAMASLLIFLWVYGRLPPKEYRAPGTPLVIGSAIAAVAFEVLKSLLALLVRGVSGSASGAVFGSVIGLLFFINIVAQMFLMIGSWIATDAHTPGGLVRADDAVPDHVREAVEAGSDSKDSPGSAGPAVGKSQGPGTVERPAKAADPGMAAERPTAGSAVARPGEGSAAVDAATGSAVVPSLRPEQEAPVAAALGVGLIAGWLIGRRGSRRSG